MGWVWVWIAATQDGQLSHLVPAAVSTTHLHFNPRLGSRKVFIDRCRAGQWAGAKVVPLPSAWLPGPLRRLHLELTLGILYRHHH
jgi:hypothetical protein